MNRLIVYVGILMLAIGVGILSWMVVDTWNAEPQATNRPAVGGPFTLLDHTGKTVTEADFKGRHMLIFFGYTYCPDVCPTSLQTISDALNLMGENAKNIQPVFVSVDSARDTPDVMKLYVEAFDGRIAGLSGNEDQIKTITNAYGVYYAKVENPDAPESYHMNHSALVYLMGPDGQYLAHFPHGVTPKEMAAKLIKVLG